MLDLLTIGVLALDPTVSDADAAKHIGETVSLDCPVAAYTRRTVETLSSNCGGAYPNQSATIVVFSSAATKVGDVKQYEGKHLVVHGMLKNYKGKPEIILETSSQIESAR